MTEQLSHFENPSYQLSAHGLAGKALVDEYITFDEAERIRMHSIPEVLTLITARIETRGDDLPDVLKRWGVLNEVLEYLKKTE